MNRQLSFQERREAFAARRGRFVDMHEDDNFSPLHTPVASVAASFDNLDDMTPLMMSPMTMKTVTLGRLGLVICACLPLPPAQPPRPPIPPRPSRLGRTAACLPPSSGKPPCPPIPPRPSLLRRAACLPLSSGLPPLPPILTIHRPRKLRHFLGRRPTRMMRISLSVSASPSSFITQGFI